MAFASFVRVLVSVVCVQSAGASFALGLSDFFFSSEDQAEIRGQGVRQGLATMFCEFAGSKQTIGSSMKTFMTA